MYVEVILFFIGLMICEGGGWFLFSVGVLVCRYFGLLKMSIFEEGIFKWVLDVVGMLKDFWCVYIFYF